MIKIKQKLMKFEGKWILYKNLKYLIKFNKFHNKIKKLNLFQIKMLNI